MTGTLSQAVQGRNVVQLFAQSVIESGQNWYLCCFSASISFLDAVASSWYPYTQLHPEIMNAYMPNCTALCGVRKPTRETCLLRLTVTD